jgi:hypothetical protein
MEFESNRLQQDMGIMNHQTHHNSREIADLNRQSVFLARQNTEAAQRTSETSRTNVMIFMVRIVCSI